MYIHWKDLASQTLYTSFLGKWNFYLAWLCGQNKFTKMCFENITKYPFNWNFLILSQGTPQLYACYLQIVMTGTLRELLRYVKKRKIFIDADISNTILMLKDGWKILQSKNVSAHGPSLYNLSIFLDFYSPTLHQPKNVQNASKNCHLSDPPSPFPDVIKLWS